MNKLYCIEVARELEEMVVLHHRFDHEPSREEILAYVKGQQDLNYDDRFGKLDYYEVL